MADSAAADVSAGRRRSLPASAPPKRRAPAAEPQSERKASAKRQRRVMKRFNMSVLSTVRLPAEEEAYLHGLCFEAARRGLVIDFASWMGQGTIPDERLHLMLQSTSYSGILCTPRDALSAHVVEQCVRLDVISALSAEQDLDHIDVAYCQQRGVSVGVVPEELSAAARADGVALLVLNAVRNFPFVLADAKGANESRTPTWSCGNDTRGRVVALCGVKADAALAVAVAARLRPFGFVIMAGEEVEDEDDEEEEEEKVAGGGDAKEDAAAVAAAVDSVTSFDAMVREADVLVPLRGMATGALDAAVFGQMKPHALLVCTRSANVFVEDDLLDALTGGAIAGAVLATTIEDDTVSERLRACDNCLYLNDVATCPVETRRAMTRRAIDNLVVGLFRHSKLRGALCVEKDVDADLQQLEPEADAGEWLPKAASFAVEGWRQQQPSGAAVDKTTTHDEGYDD